MLIVGNVILSEDILERRFACQLDKCKGSCCVQGDAGAPLEEEEVEILRKELDSILPFLSEEGKQEISHRGFSEIDDEDEYVTGCGYLWHRKSLECRKNVVS
jgi:hypothetical protein